MNLEQYVMNEMSCQLNLFKVYIENFNGYES